MGNGDDHPCLWMVGLEWELEWISQNWWKVEGAALSCSQCRANIVGGGGRGQPSSKYDGISSL